MTNEPLQGDLAKGDPLTHIVYMSSVDPKLIARKAPHGPGWSVWMILEYGPSEEIFEASSEEEAADWINNVGPKWLEERRRKRSAQ